MIDPIHFTEAAKRRIERHKRGDAQMRLLVGSAVIAMIVAGAIGVRYFKAESVGGSNDWGSQYGNENVRNAIRDEMITNGTAPEVADAYTKLQYERERSAGSSLYKSSKHGDESLRRAFGSPTP